MPVAALCRESKDAIHHVSHYLSVKCSKKTSCLKNLSTCALMIISAYLQTLSLLQMNIILQSDSQLV